MSDDPRVDAIWESLAPHVEWARGFSLILLFASHPAPVEQIRVRLESSLRASGRVLHVIDPGAYADAKALTLAVLAKPLADCGARWIPLWWHDTDGAREFLLARLNERRFLLERDVTRPLVLVLPTDYRTKISGVAPDLWVVRSFSQQLPDPAVQLAQPRERAIATREVFVVQPPGVAELEWRRLVSARNQTGLAIEDGLFAFQSARTRGSLWDARRIAIEMLTLAVRGRVDGDAIMDVNELLANAESSDSQARRDLAIAFDCLAEVEEQAGNLGVARELYGRSLEVREALAKADPHGAHAQRELSVSLIEVGGVEEDAGNLGVARELYGRSLEVLEALAKADPHDAQAQRELSVSYYKLAGVEAQAGDLVVARKLYARSAEINEALAKVDPHSAQAQVDVADVLHQLGRLAATAGNVNECRDHLERASAILDELDAKGQLRGYTERETMRERVRAMLAFTAPGEPSG
ncbi:tetratricopeptide repeat protein [Nannocystaceae bacterium ST9]